MARTAARVLLGLLTMGILVASGLVLGLYLGGATWAVNRVLEAVNPYPGTTLEIARVGGSLFRTVRVYDVRLIRPDGAIPVRLDSLTLTYDLRSLLGGSVLIQDARLAGPSVILTQRPDSKWDLLDIPRGASDSSSSSGSSRAGVTIERLSITGGSARVHFAGSSSGRASRGEAGGGRRGDSHRSRHPYRPGRTAAPSPAAVRRARLGGRRRRRVARGGTADPRHPLPALA